MNSNIIDFLIAVMSKESAVPTDLKLHADEQVYKVIRPVSNAFLGSFIAAILLMKCTESTIVIAYTPKIIVL